MRRAALQRRAWTSVAASRQPGVSRGPTGRARCMGRKRAKVRLAMLRREAWLIPADPARLTLAGIALAAWMVGRRPSPQDRANAESGRERRRQAQRPGYAKSSIASGTVFKSVAKTFAQTRQLLIDLTQALVRPSPRLNRIVTPQYTASSPLATMRFRNVRGSTVGTLCVN